MPFLLYIINIKSIKRKKIFKSSTLIVTLILHLHNEDDLQ